MPKSRSSRSKSPQKPLSAAEIATQLEREKIFQNVQEMFKETVDADVIHMVLTECNWRGEEAIDKLLAIGENSEIQRQYKSKSQLQQIAEGVFGSLRSEEHPHHGSPISNRSSLQSSPLSQKDKVIQRPARNRSTEKPTDIQTQDSHGNSHLHIPLAGLSSRGSGTVDAQLSPGRLVDDIELDLHFPRLPVRKPALSRSSTSSPISSHRSFSSQAQSGSQPDLISEAQTAYQQQYDDAAGAQRWEQCKNRLSDHYMKSIGGTRSNSEDLPERRHEKAAGPYMAKSRSTEEPGSAMMSPVFMDDPAIIQSQKERLKAESSRSFPVRLLSRSPDDEAPDARGEGKSDAAAAGRLDSADLDETVLKCIYEVHDDLLDEAMFGDRKMSYSGRTSDLDSERLSAGTPGSSGHVTPVPSSQPMTLPVIGLSAHAAEFVPRQPKSNSEKSLTGEDSPANEKSPTSDKPTSKKDVKVKDKAPVKAARSNSIEIQSSAKNMRMSSPTVQVASPSSLGVSPGHSPVVSPPSPNVGSPATTLAGSPMFITPKWQPFIPRLPTTPPPPIRPPVNVIPASGTRYITPPPPHHIPPPQYRLQATTHLPFSSRIVYPMAPPPPVFRVAGLSPGMQPQQLQPTMSPHQLGGTSVEERARIATGQPIMATSEVGRHATPPTQVPGIPMQQFINQPSIEKNVSKIRELHQAGKKVLVIIRGLPGSGKSTLSRALQLDGIVLSTDDYFMKGDMYDYNPDKLAESHQWNRERAKEAIKMGTSPIIIDNTNTQRWEFKPYVSMALNNNYHVEIIEPDTPWKNSPKELARLTLHGVPKDHIQRMLQRYERNITVDMLTTKKKAANPANTNQGSFEDDSGPVKDVKPSEEMTKTRTKMEGEVVKSGKASSNDWDINHGAAAPVWPEGSKNSGSRSSSVDKETESLLGMTNAVIAVNLNGGNLPNKQPSKKRKPPSLQGFNQRAKSQEKLEVSAQKDQATSLPGISVPTLKVPSKKSSKDKAASKATKKKAAANKPEVELSEETVKVVEEMVAEYVNDKSLSAEDLSKVEQELKALLQIYGLEDKERSGAEMLIGFKLHGAPNPETSQINNEEKKQSANNKRKKALTLIQSELEGGDSEKHICAEISVNDIAIESVHMLEDIGEERKMNNEENTHILSNDQTSKPTNMISSKINSTTNNTQETNNLTGAIDIENNYWGKKLVEDASADVVEPVSTEWKEDCMEHHNKWSDEEIPSCSNNDVVRPQRERKSRHNSINSKLKQTSSNVSPTNSVDSYDSLVQNKEAETKAPLSMLAKIVDPVKNREEENPSKVATYVDPDETAPIGAVSSGSTMLACDKESNEELNNTGSSKDVFEENFLKEFDLSDMNVSGNSSYLTALDNSQSSGENKTSDVFGDSQENTEKFGSADNLVEVEEISDSDADGSCMNESPAKYNEDDAANIQDEKNDSKEIKNIESSVSTDSRNEDANSDKVTVEATIKADIITIESVGTSESKDAPEPIINVTLNTSLSLLKDSYIDSGTENSEENSLARSQEDIIDESLTEIKTHPHVHSENAQNAESIIDRDQDNLDIVPDENQNMIAMAADEQGNTEMLNTDTIDENQAEKNPEKRKRSSRRKMAANFRTPFLNETDKENFLKADWNQFPIISEHLNSTSTVSEASNYDKTEPDRQHQETMTTDEDFTTLNILCQGGFVASSTHYIIPQKRKLTCYENGEMNTNNNYRNISDRHTINKSTSTDDLKAENHDESVAFLNTCFPNTNQEELECVLAYCDNNAEWAVELLLEWNYDTQLSAEEKAEFVERLESLTNSSSPAKPNLPTDKKQPSFLRDICFNLIEEKKIATKEELEQQLIVAGKERLDRIEDENITKIRLRRSSSMSDTSPRGHKTSLNSSGLSVTRSLSTPIAAYDNKTDSGTKKEDKNIDSVTELIDHADVFSPKRNTEEERAIQENGAIENDEQQMKALTEVRSISINEAVETDYALPNDSNDGKKESAVVDERLNRLEKYLEDGVDAEGDREHVEVGRSAGVMKMKIEAGLVSQLEQMFGAVGANNRGVCGVEVEIDQGTAWKLYQCLKHSLADSRQKIRRQLAQDEEFARLLQEEENSSRSVAENQSASLKTGPPPLVGLSGYQGGLPPTAKPVQSRPRYSRPVKTLMEIMEEEAQIQSKEQHFQKLVEYEGGHTQLATRMKRNKLYDRFPDLDRAMLDEVFQNHCFNLTETVSHIEHYLGEGHKVPGVDGVRDETLLQASKLQSIQDQLNSYLYMPHVSKDYQDGGRPEYEDYRGEANVHHRLRHECFQKAQEAHRRGLKQVAVFYSQQGHLHTQKIKEANMRASELILEDRNHDIEANQTLDLHGLHVDEAIAALDRILPQKQRDQRKGHLMVITGRGNHSRGGVARLRPSVIAYLKKQQYNFTETQQGIIKVSMRYKK